MSDAERPRLGNDIYQHPFRPQPIATDPQDGLPRVASTLTMEDAAAPALDPETFVCMGDESAFVIRDEWGDVLVTVDPSVVVPWRDDDGTYLRVAPLTEEQLSKSKASVWAYRGETNYYVVTPLRAQCEHYKRVMTDFEGSDEHKTVERVCSAQRTEGGEYVALKDTRVYACEHRVPRDFVSEDRLRKFDAARVAEGKKTVEYWDGEAALEAALRAEEEQNDNG